MCTALLASALLGLERLNRLATRPRKFSYLKSYALQVETSRLDEAEFLSLDKEEVAFASPFGYPLRGTYFPLSGARRTLILLHGFAYTRAGMYKYIPMAQRLGFNVLAYDHRYHGQSGGAFISFGYYEKDDLRAAATWAAARLGSGGQIGVLGESLGAVTALQAAAGDARLAFVIADCPYASLAAQFARRLRHDFDVPILPLLPLALTWMRLRCGFSARQVSPLRAAAQLQAPLLLFHGLADTDVPPADSQRLAQAKIHGLCRLVLVPAAGHLDCFLHDPLAYEQAIRTFLADGLFPVDAAG